MSQPPSMAKSVQVLSPPPQSLYGRVYRRGAKIKSPWTNPQPKKPKTKSVVHLLPPVEVDTLKKIDENIAADFKKWLEKGKDQIDLVQVGKVDQNWFKGLITPGSWLQDEVIYSNYAFRKIYASFLQ